MNLRQSYYREPYRSTFRKSTKLRNDLNIERVEYIKDSTHQNLIVLLESNMGLTQDINISIRGAQMVIEAIHDLGYSKPFRSHLIEKEILNEFDQEGILELGCSEIQLHHGYNYNLVSYQVISPSLLKVILRYDKSNNNTSYIN